MRVAFFSTSDRSLPVLKSLYESKHLVFCVTKSDVTIGRNKEIRENATKTFCKEHNIDYIEIDNLKTESAQAVSKYLFDKHVELCVVADFAFLIPESLFSLPKYGMVNVHFSLLPKYRGASPVQFAIKNCDTATGITLHLIDKGMDTGNILYQRSVPLNAVETTDTLYNRLFDLTGELMPEFIENYEKGIITPLPQNHGEATYTRSENNPKSTFISKEDAKIDWNKTPKQIECEIRAYYPWPISWTYIEELQNNNKMASIFTLRSSQANSKIKIYTAKIVDNKLMPIEVQPENKNKMSWESFLNGYTKP